MKTFIKSSLITFLFFSCKHGSIDKKAAAPTASTALLDTIKTRPPTINVRPVVFESAFINGTILTTRNSVFSSYGITIGKIKIVSGRIIACDPLHIDEYGIPFTQSFPIGEFSVQLAIAKLEDEEVVAFARISFSDEPVVKWEMALQEGQKALPFGLSDIRGYSTDSWSGLFIDTEAYKVLDKDQILKENGAVYKEMKKHSHNNWRYGMYNFGNHNLAVFSSGFQDGYYATYIGFDAKGKPCRLITDFDIFEWRKK